ncbi:MAG: AgmX/PglI C-terminal domain-containing protein [Calditrichia bacterium]
MSVFYYIYFLLFCSSALISVAAQSPENSFLLKQFGGNGDNFPTGIACSPDGSIFLAGVFEDELSSQEKILHSSGKCDIYLGKVSTAGKAEWLVKAGGTGTDILLDIATDNYGNTYIAGTFEDIIFFDNESYLQAIGYTDAFVARLNSNGDIDWQVQLGGNYQDFCAAVTADHLGNLIVAGSFENDALFGKKIVTGFGQTDAFIAKLDRQTGEVIWVREIGGGKQDCAWDIKTDGSGNIIVAGEFREIALVGKTQLTARGGADIYVAKFSSDGQPLWAKQLGGQYDDSARQLAVDHYNSIYLAGNFNDIAQFGSEQLISLGGAEAFVVRMKSNGAIDWARRAGGPGDDQVLSLALNQQQECHITGKFAARAAFGEHTVSSDGATDVFLASLDSRGNWNSAEAIGGHKNDSGSALAVDRNNRLLLAGTFEDSLLFGEKSLQSLGRRDTFLTRLDPNRNGSNHGLRLTRATQTDFGVVQASANYEGMIAVADDNKRLVKSCLRRTYRNDPTFKGHMVVKFMIHAKGFVIPESVTILKSNLRDRRLIHCITKNIKRWKNFPAADSGVYPIVQKYIF